ncbi:hypothetical protein [Actinomadura xylanilytica]|uniref:hypothetical protein n=1 Tax=Actinomadura xylanilytica TaxID=887459 RepID=UPI00255B321A|nr:hypothetical protein [Actinomadura xylanilytica]MDL4775230.1 hypothetical protein [Actinomadura xylanilytica]
MDRDSVPPGPPRPLTDTSRAVWLEREVTGDASVVAALLPACFEAYARVLHPAEDADGGPVRWDAAASWAGGAIHPRVQFRALAALRRGTPDDPAPWDEPPARGTLAAPQLRALCAVLARHTGRADDCLFCIWEGWGWLGGSPATGVLRAESAEPGGPPPSRDPAPPPLPAPPRELLDGPRVRLPWRDHLLLAGPLAAASEIGDRGPGYFFQQSPNVFWPADRAWCAATDIELDSTYVGGSAALVAELLDDPRLETVRASPRDPLGEHGDDVNGG